MTTKKRKWIATLIAFVGGFFLVGPLDAFHSHTGVQFYEVERFNISFLANSTGFNWPWFIPLQMGIAGIFLLFNWDLHVRLLNKWIPASSEKRANPGFIYIFGTLMVIGGYILAWVLDENPFHLSYYLSLYVASLLGIALVWERNYLIAFILVGIWGTLFETILLDPAIGYYRFDHWDFWGRSPGWLLFVYGWVGIFIHELCSWMRNGSITD